MKYALFLGCSVPVRGINYELSVREISKVLGIELVDIPEFTCCGFPTKSVKIDSQMLMSAKNISIAEEKGLDIVCLCSACSVTLTETLKEIKEHKDIRDKINDELKTLGFKPVEGKIKIRHFARVLFEDIGIEKIKEKIVKPLTGFSIAAHYGCHYFKPSEAYDHWEDPENPKSLDELIKVTGAESTKYSYRNQCCGGAILGVDKNLAYKMTYEKLQRINEQKADAMVLFCTFCSIMYEGNQKAILKEFEADFNMPVLYITQLLGLAMGISPDTLGFKLNRIRPKEFLQKFEQI
ncbi:MAG: CoB--CoM heterodisulfide reductase iron-sulfur subunit B family protein [bacterium]|nr:CoB--CoM heterodisulfide reductase iron-sulfur subunit B family protein [bacterium]